MYLEQVDIDAFFPHRKVMVGPLSPGLNAIFGEAGAGKTAIIDFLRAVMLGGMRWNTSTAGRVVWCDTDGLLVCRREVDGTADGRLTFERLGRDGRSVFEGHAAIQGKQLAAEWIDAIVCPLGNALEQSRRALAAARHAGIEVAGRDEETPEYRATRLRLEEIERELAYRGHGVDTIESLELRRQQLRDQLQRLPTEVDQTALERWREEMRRAESEWTSAKRELHRCETQRAELLRGIDAVRHELATMAPVPADSAPRYALTEQERRHLEDLDDRLVRGAARCVRSVRYAINWTSAQPTCESTPKWFKAVCMIALMPAVRYTMLTNISKPLAAASIGWSIVIIETSYTLPKKLAGWRKLCGPRAMN